MSALKIRFLGCGDAFGSGGRFNTCFHVTSPGGAFLIDCGASSLVAMKRWRVDPAAIDAIVISHLHGDHFGGIPFFLLDAKYVHRRSRPLTIAGPPGIEERVRATAEALFPGSSEAAPDFPLRFLELPEGSTSAVTAYLEAAPRAVVHPSGAPSYALRLELAGKVIAFSGDTEWTDALLDVARGSDLFICECYRFEGETRYHLDYRTLQARRGELGARRMVLTHLSDEMLARLDEVDLECAEDGLELSV